MTAGGKQTWSILWTCASILLGNGLLAFAVEAFVIPHGIIMGGTTGIAIVLDRVLPLDTASIVFILNALLLVLGGVVLGKKLVATTLASSLLYPGLLAIIHLDHGDPRLQTCEQRPADGLVGAGYDEQLDLGEP